METGNLIYLLMVVGIQGGQLAAINLESRAALLVAKKVMTFEFAETLKSHRSATKHDHLLH